MEPDLLGTYSAEMSVYYVKLPFYISRRKSVNPAATVQDSGWLLRRFRYIATQCLMGVFFFFLGGRIAFVDKAKIEK